MIELAENPGRYKELDDHPATGEVPEDYQRVPADKLIDNVARPFKNMKDVTRKYWQDNRNYFRVVKRFGKDVVGYSSNHGTGFIIGIGAASIAAGIGGYVMYRHRKRRH